MHVELIQTSRKLLCSNDGNPPSATDLRKAVSATYYSLFHFISFCCVRSLLGASIKSLTRAKNQAYRSLDHRDIEAACAKARLPDLNFPQEIKTFASLFVTMRRNRERADYDPDQIANFNLPHVQFLVRECEEAMTAYELADEDDKKAFAVLVLVKIRAGSRT